MDDAVFIGGPEKREIVIEDYDPAWTARFEQVHAALRQALGPTRAGSSTSARPPCPASAPRGSSTSW